MSYQSLETIAALVDGAVKSAASVQDQARAVLAAAQSGDVGAPFAALDTLKAFRDADLAGWMRLRDELKRAKVPITELNRAMRDTSESAGPEAISDALVELARARADFIHDPDGEPYAVINLMGRTYMEAVDCPFQTAQSLLDTIPGDVRIRLVDFHAEATSEKRAMGFFLDGRVSAVLGTHTHVQTNDAQVLPRGTAYMTDLGMCGPAQSVLGMDSAIIVSRFLSRLPTRFEVAKNPASLAGALLDIDTNTGQALAVSPWKGE